MAKKPYHSYRGKVGLRKIVGGVPGEVVWRGNAPKLVLNIDADEIQHFETSSGYDTQDAKLTRKKSVMVDMTLEEMSDANVDLVLNGVTTEIGGATVTDLSLGTVAVNKEIWLGMYGLSDVSIKDSAGTPVTVNPSKYVLDADFGTLLFKDITGYTAPFKITATAATSKATTIASNFDDEYQLVFKGVNIYTNEKVVLELWRVTKSPKSQLALINEGFGSWDVTATCLSDVDKLTVDPTLGLFGRFIRVGSPAELYQ